MKLIYFGVKARSWITVAIAAYGGVELVWEKDVNWPAFKDQTPFGQLPVLIDGEIKIGQSMAIARYVSKKQIYKVKVMISVILNNFLKNKMIFIIY